MRPDDTCKQTLLPEGQPNIALEPSRQTLGCYSARRGARLSAGVRLLDNRSQFNAVTEDAFRWRSHVTRTWLALFIVSSVAIFLSAAEPALAPTNPGSVGLSAERLQMIARAVRSEIDQGAIPRAVVAVARKGKLAYYESFGFLDKDKNLPMRKDAIFAVASMTKPFTATGALMLVEEGRILLNDPVGRCLPKLTAMRVATDSGTEPARKQATLQDLMRHTAGLTYGSATGSELSKRYAAEFTRLSSMKPAEFIERLSKLPLHCQPGSRWDYGLGHEVMGVVIESLTKQRLGDYLEERLFGPMAMSDTGFFVPLA